MTLKELLSNDNNNTTASVKGACACAERSTILWKSLNGNTANALLATKPTGSYLLRKSNNPLYEYALSEKTSNGIIHIRISRNSKTGLYSMDGFPASRVLGFNCVINLVEAWSRIHKAFGLKNMRHPVHVTSNDESLYVNVDMLCFHDDNAAEKRLQFLVKSYLRRRSLLYFVE